MLDRAMPMSAADFRRAALRLEGAEEGSHMGAADFRVGGRIFATLASVGQGYGNLMLSPEIQAAFVEERPDLFVRVAGGWGRGGATHIRLGVATADELDGALRAAWRLRVEKNATTKSRRVGPSASKPRARGSAAPRAPRHKRELPSGRRSPGSRRS